MNLAKQNEKLRAIRLREYLPAGALAVLRSMPYELRRLRMRHIRAILAGLV